MGCACNCAAVTVSVVGAGLRTALPPCADAEPGISPAPDAGSGDSRVARAAFAAISSAASPLTCDRMSDGMGEIGAPAPPLAAPNSSVALADCAPCGPYVDRKS